MFFQDYIPCQCGTGKWSITGSSASQTTGIISLHGKPFSALKTLWITTQVKTTATAEQIYFPLETWKLYIKGPEHEVFVMPKTCSYYHRKSLNLDVAVIYTNISLVDLAPVLMTVFWIYGILTCARDMLANNTIKWLQLPYIKMRKL